MLFCLFCLDIFATGLFGGDERALAIARSFFLPGLAFLEWHVVLGVVTIALALFAFYSWMRWGADWFLLLIVSGSAAIAAFLMPVHHHHHDDNSHSHEHSVLDRQTEHTDQRRLFSPDVEVRQAGHEFLIVLIVFTAIAKLRLALGRFVNFDGLERYVPEIFKFHSSDAAQEMVFRRLAGAPASEILNEIDIAKYAKQAQFINTFTRFRWRGDVWRKDHAVQRACLAMAGALNVQQLKRFQDEGSRSNCGVPNTVPTWVRLLDGMLAAIALDQMGEEEAVRRWRHTLETRFALHGGRRSAVAHAPSMLSIGTAPAWEHATATALGRLHGWLPDTDWAHLRPRVLGAASGGEKDAATLRLVAAGRLWAALVGDAEASDILNRRNVTIDPVASAIDELAIGLAKDQRFIVGANG